MKWLVIVGMFVATLNPSVCLAAGQERPSRDVNSVLFEGAAPDYRVGPGDVLSVRVSGLREFDQSLHVSNSGRVRVPYVGVLLVAGMTTIELEHEIAGRIRERELVNQPAVRVQVEQHRSQPVYVVGDVVTPGQYMVSSEMYLFELITMAGGLAATAADKAFLYRRNWPQPVITSKLVAGAPTVGGSAAAVEEAAKAPLRPPSLTPEIDDASMNQVIEIDTEALRTDGRSELNIRLQGGDVLFVPRARPKNIYIVGDVQNPGAYTLPRRGEISFAQAVTFAGGPMRTAKTSDGFVVRRDEQGNRQIISADFVDIIRGRKPDIPVRQDDILYIPSGTLKTIGIGLFDMIPGLIIQYLIF